MIHSKQHKLLLFNKKIAETYECDDSNAKILSFI